MKFNLKTLFLAMALVGVWLAGIRIDSALGVPLFHQLTMTMVFAGSCLSAFFLRGRGTRSAFWLGVTLVLALRAIPHGWLFSAFKSGLEPSSRFHAMSKLGIDSSFGNALSLLWLIVAATITGWLSAMIYDWANEESS